MIPTMYAAGVIGTMGGTCLALQASFGRLTGYLPNEVEVEKYSQRDGTQ